MSTNYSFYGIPVFYIVCMLPHIFAVSSIKRASNNKWDNSKPRSTTWDATIRSSVPAAVYAKYERAESAHKNGLENFPLFTASVIVGNLAQLEVVYMNAFVTVYCASRLLYNILYINISTSRESLARSVVWLIGVVMCLFTMVNAAAAFAALPQEVTQT